MQSLTTQSPCLSEPFLIKYEIPYRIYHVDAKEQTLSSIRANMIHPSLPDWFLYEYQVNVINLQNKNVLLVSGTGSGKYFYNQHR